MRGLRLLTGARAEAEELKKRLQVPSPQAYFEPINWHRTAFHELAHGSVRPSSQPRSGSYGTKKHALEELIPKKFSLHSRALRSGSCRRYGMPTISGESFR
jgi:hypothetical protein